MAKSVVQRSFAVMLLGLIGLALGITILLVGARATPESAKFVDQSEFLLWLLVISTETALFAIFAVPVVRILRQLWLYLHDNKTEIVVSSTVFTALYFAPGRLTEFILPGAVDFQLLYFSARTGVIGGIGYLTIGLPAAVGIWLVHIASRDLGGNDKLGQDHVERYLCLGRLLKQLISVLGLVVGIAILGTGANRHAHIAAGVDFPVSLVLAYGVYFTLVLAVIYFPAQASLLETGRRIRDSLCPLPSPDSGSWGEVYAKHKSLTELLEIRTTVVESFRTGVAILAPLLGAIISTLLA